jgi:AraC-like DNA-binding protein
MRIDLALLFDHILSVLLSNPEISLTNISSSIGVDRHKIEAAVRIHGGISFRELKNRSRLKKALLLLHNNPINPSIKEIAARLKMSPNALSRFIKTMTGHSATYLLTNNDR